MQGIVAMAITQEFLILEDGDTVGVYAPRDFPRGTVIGRDAKRLRVVGETGVRPPGLRLARPEFDRWRHQLEEAGHSVTLGPFRTNPEMLTKSAADFRREEFLPLRDAFDELLRHAEGRRQADDRPMGPVESRHP